MRTSVTPIAWKVSKATSVPAPTDRRLSPAPGRSSGTAGIRRVCRGVWVFSAGNERVWDGAPRGGDSRTQWRRGSRSGGRDHGAGGEQWSWDVERWLAGDPGAGGPRSSRVVAGAAALLLHTAHAITGGGGGQSIATTRTCRESVFGCRGHRRAGGR